jgi:hypothetical protein
MWTDNLIRFPQERRTAAVEDYREEPAKVLVLYIGQRQSSEVPSTIFGVPIRDYDPLLGVEPAERCRELFDAIRRMMDARAKCLRERS